jgi:dienelactone hydrolase
MHVVYITGLGDSHPVWQIRAVMKTWQLYGVAPHFFRVGWADDEPLRLKLARLEKRINELYEADRQKVGLVGVSAGASLALHAFVANQNKATGVVTICGKLLQPEKVGKQVRLQNPAFAESMDGINEIVQGLTPQQRKKILCVYPLTDRRVSVEDQYIEGANKRRVYSFGHTFTIATQLLFGARKNIRFLKKVEARK